MPGDSHQTCLFTGVPLLEPQAEEHAPPAGLGGRFVSRWGVSSDFNNKAGGLIDRHLVECYLPITVRIAHLMSGRHRSSRSIPVSFPEDARQYKLDPGGGLSLAKNQILQRDAERKPTAAAGPNIMGLEAMGRGLGWEMPVQRYTLDIDVERPDAFSTHVSQTHFAEIGALKTVLTVFDVEHRYSTDSWVRSPAAAAARELVRVTVEEERVPFPEYDAIVWGSTPTLIPQIRGFKAFSHRRPGVLDHVIIAAGNAATRTIDCSWAVFGHIVLSFRLSCRYRGPDFCDIAICCPLRGGEPVSRLETPYRWVLPRDKGLRTLSASGAPPSDQVLNDWHGKDLAEAVAHAGMFAELQPLGGSAQLVYGYFLNLLKNGKAPVTALDYLHRRFNRSYGGLFSELSAAIVVDEILGPDRVQRLASLKLVAEHPEDFSYLPSWASELGDTYVELLREFYHRYGPSPIMASMRTAKRFVPKDEKKIDIE